MSPNALANEKSPFLQHGAQQPVAWMPWGDAAFERARNENKPVLLDIGAVWCHWCHVMDRESYDDPATADLINQNFVAIKVDRDERPDVDARYQRAVQTFTGQGGWPLTAFLTPDGDVYYGGTYFPPTDAYGRPSFRRVLSEVARVWREEPQRARDAVQSIAERLGSYAQAEAQAGKVTRELVTQTVEELAQAFDFRYGGFGRAPKFPNSSALALLIDHHLDTSLDWSGRMVVETLDAMARGGIYDQLGGGFHRYATDARWIIPHFEKMAYDNGPLLEVYARAYAATRAPLYKEIADGIVAYYEDVASDMLNDGGFPASQDADYSPSDDGDYWTWTREELQAALTQEEYDAAARFYGLEEDASAMHLDPRRHVLFRATREDRAEVASSIAGLKRVRDARPQPFVDRTIYAGWSALVACGFLAAARHCDLPRAAEHAVRTLNRLWAEAFDPDTGVAHRLGDRAAGTHLDDQAYMLQAALDAFELTQDGVWLERAVRIADVAAARFQDASGAFRDRPRDAGAVVSALEQPYYPIADAPTPSGNGVMAICYLRLAELLHDERFRDRAETVINAFAGTAARLTSSAATYVRAVDWLTGEASAVVVVGRQAAGSEPLWQAALQSYRPRTIIRYFEADAVATEQLAPELQAMITSDAPRAYVCAGRRCAAPVNDPDVLRDLLASF